MKKFHKSQWDPNPSRRVNLSLKKGYPARRADPGWLLRSCKYLLQVDRRRVDPLRRVEANPGSCKGGLRDTCLEHYSVDPAHFYTSPGLAWKACLTKTRVRLELLTDPDMLVMFERGIRGGITQAVHHYASANNPYMGDLYDPSEESSYLQYLDTNNLYGWAMSQPLPTGRFRWVDVKPNEIRKLAKREDKGCLLEVDVSYPRDLHDSHNDLPFMCERFKIGGIEKLVPNLRTKQPTLT